MTQDTGRTEFASPERDGTAVVLEQSHWLDQIAHMRQLFDAMLEGVMIVNENRQIVFCNQSLIKMLGVEKPNDLIGMRPGEAVGCVHSSCNNGCGTTEFCKTCGAVKAILTSQQGRQDVQECRILRDKSGEAMDLLVRTTPLSVASGIFSIVAISDISHEKRRKALERIFFHDLLNTVASVRLYSELLQKVKPERASEVAEGIHRSVTRLTEEISSQRDLISAECNELPVRPIAIESKLLLAGIMQTNVHFQASTGCRLLLDGGAKDFEFQSDATILSRVLGNMIKNAIEASSAGDVVTIGCEGNGTEASFWVHNPAFIPREVELQIFQRSFSTKGRGRGLGTYSMKLLTERYLKGRIVCVTSPKDGTTFRITLPLKLS